MRRFTLSLLAISFFIIVFSGCTKQQSKTPNQYFTATAQLKTDDITYTATVTSSQDDVIIKVDSPDTVAGLKYQRTNSTLYIEYDGLKCITQGDYLASDNPIDVLIDTLSALSDSPPQYTKTEDEYDIYVGATDNGDYTLYIDKESDNIVRIVPSYTDCEISFTEINI